MKTKKEVLNENPEFKTLINAVINRIGLESVEDVIKNGADSGFSGFIYYSETHSFAMRHRRDIISLLKYSVDCMGDGDVMSLVKSFGVFRNPGFDQDDENDFYAYMGNGRPKQGTLTNVMAWFALEEVCRMFDN